MRTARQPIDRDALVRNMRFSRFPSARWRDRSGRVNQKKVDRFMAAMWTFNKVVSAMERLESEKERKPARNAGNEKISRG